jgi:lipopolysaccharide transport system ATP-binding protein
VSDTIIRVENLGKKYIIGHQQERSYRHKTLRDTIVDGTKSIRSRFLNQTKDNNLNPAHEEFWALKDVYFEIKQGDRVGIIGRNGAGKSTLLKILSRITEPTTGRISITGRVASLLEVGTGFHAELTGRENIYLNGAILGMSQVEIKRKFDEIVDFAEVEKFLDTPVKRYSSGMYVRLAFAVAAHLEPEILIVDEVLAVGDVNFQKKCLGKMQDVSQGEGRTVLFVSHNTDAIQRLCLKCLLLNQGHIVSNGDTTTVMAQYIFTNTSCVLPNQWIDLNNVSRVGNGKARFVAVQYGSSSKDVDFNAYSNGSLNFLLDITSESSMAVESISVNISTQSGTRLVNTDTRTIGQIINLQRGRNIVKINIDQLYLKAGNYIIGLWLSDFSAISVFDYIESAFEIEVLDLEDHELGIRPGGDGLVSCRFQVFSNAEVKI